MNLGRSAVDILAAFLSGEAQFLAAAEYLIGRSEEKGQRGLRLAGPGRTGRNAHPRVGGDLRASQGADDGHQGVVATCAERGAVEMKENILLGEAQIGAPEEFASRCDGHERGRHEPRIGRGRHVFEVLAGFSFAVQFQLHARLRSRQIGGVQRAAELDQLKRAVRAFKLASDVALERDVRDQRTNGLRRGKVAPGKKSAGQKQQSQPRCDPGQPMFTKGTRLGDRRKGGIRPLHHLGDDVLSPILSAQMLFDLGARGPLGESLAREFHELRTLHGSNP